MVDDTQTLNAPQLEKTEVPCGMLTFYVGFVFLSMVLDEIDGGSPGRLWSTYLTETKEQDKAMIERWKGEADSAVVFVSVGPPTLCHCILRVRLRHVFKAGLFSATIAVSIVESYKKLSADPGDEAVMLLTQISRQLVNISNGIPLESVAAQSKQPFHIPAFAIRVNIMWFLSIVLCLACATYGTLIQLWTRRYLVLTQGQGTPYKRALLRKFLFNGLEKFHAEQAFNLMGLLLHTSVFLYCVGLIDFIFSINMNIGFVALGYLLFFYLIYGIVTVLPYFFFDSPYGTPFSALMWHLFHGFALGIFSTFRGIEAFLH